MKPIILSPALLAALCLAGLGVPIPVARATDYIWTGVDNAGGNGDFSTAGWTNTDTGKDNMGPPGGGDFAYIPEDTILTASSGSVMTLDAAAGFGGGLDLSGSFSAGTVGSVMLMGGGTLTAGSIAPVSGAGVGDTAENIVVIGSQLTAGSAVDPFFGVSAGGTVVLKSGIPKGEGNVSGAMSLLEIDGAVLNFNGGASAGGTFKADSIQSNNGLDAEIGSDGAGSLVTTTGNVEFDGQGIQVTNGGQAAIGGNLILYPDPTLVAGGGSAYFDGAGTAVTVAGNVYLGPGPGGNSGSYVGDITISNGASLQAGKLYADSGIAEGDIMMSNGATLNLNTGMSIGAQSKGAALQILSGSGVTISGTAPAVAIGFLANSSGMVTVSGAGSFLNASSAVVSIGKDAKSTGDLELDTSATMQLGGGTTSFLHVGDAGTGTMEIYSGATVQVAGTGASFEVGSVAGSNGDVAVASPNGLTLNAPAVIGNQGTGEMDISGDEVNGSATASGNFYVGGNGSLDASTGKGFVTVSGGAKFSLTGGSSTNTGVGNGKGSVGEIQVSGSGSALTFTGPVIAGVFGSGELAATSGATAQSARLELASAPGSFANVIVDNSGTTWTDTNSVFDGGLPGTAGGKAIISVNDGGLLRIYRRLYLANDGLVTVTVVPIADPKFPYPKPPTSATPKGRVFVGTDNFGPDGAVRVGTGGVLSGKGKQTGTKVIHTNVLGNVVVGLGGKFQPGGDPDVFSIEGDCDLSDGGAAKGGGETDIEVAGPGTAGTDYDQLIASGKVTLGGTLRLVLMEGYKPKVGDTMDPVKGGTMTGNFKEVVAPGLTFYPEAKSGKLSVKVMSVLDIPAPVITSEKAAMGYVGTAFNYQITATGMPAGYAATGLPNGLEIDPSTGLITGTPMTTGTSSVKLTSTSVGGTGQATLSLTIDSNPPPVGHPIITSATSVTALPGVPFSYQITVFEGADSYGATGLPPGLSLNAATGLISGTRTGAGTATVTLSATNAAGTGTATLTISSALPVATVSATTPTVTVGSGDSGVFTVKLSSAQTSEVVVNYKVTGTAMNGKDYVLLTGKKKFKPGKTSKPIRITPLGDLEGAASKIVKLSLENGTGYTAGTAKPVKVKILGKH